MQHLRLGGALTGVIIGIAAQQALETSDGPLLIPNSSLLSAGVGARPDPVASIDLTESVGLRR